MYVYRRWADSSNLRRHERRCKLLGYDLNKPKVVGSSDRKKIATAVAHVAHANRIVASASIASAKAEHAIVSIGQQAFVAAAAG